MAHSEEFWQNEVHWKRKWQPTPVFMPQEPHEHYENAKEDMTSGDEPRRSECVQYALGKSGGGVDGLSRNEDQLMYLVMKLKSGTAKDNIA